MNYKLKNALRLLLEFLVIYYGMGCPLPTNLVDGIKLVISMVAVAYTGYKNHDFTLQGRIGTEKTRELKIKMDCDEEAD